jgi:hypothetical protein
MSVTIRLIPIAAAMLSTVGAASVAIAQDPSGDRVWVSALRRDNLAILSLHKGLEITPQDALLIDLYFLNQPCKLSFVEAKEMNRALNLQYVRNDAGKWVTSSVERCWVLEPSGMVRELSFTKNLSRRPRTSMRSLDRDGVVTQDKRVIVTDDEPLDVQNMLPTVLPPTPIPTIQRWPIP